MQNMNEVTLQWFRDANSALGYTQPHRYYLNSILRYAHTLDLASKYVTFDEEVRIAEVGVGMLLPMIKIRSGCQATAYGLPRERIVGRSR